jgi:hypothetical protein
MDKIFWTGYSNGERHAAISSIQGVVSRYGDIVDVHLFSDVSLSLTIEIEESKMDKLYDALTHEMRIQQWEPLYSISKQERIIYLHITFAKGTGKLKIEVPAVPG